MKASHKYTGVLNRSLEFSAEDYISARSAWRDCARRMRKLAGFLVTTVLCVGTVQPARPQRWALAPVLYAPVDVCGPPLKAERSPLAGGPVG